MATCGASGTSEGTDILSASPRTNQGILSESLIFVDTAAVAQFKSLKPNILEQVVASLQNGAQQDIHSIPTRPRTRTINQELLKLAVDRKCAHVYVLSDHASLSTTISILNQHCIAESVPCTILALGPNVVLTPTNGWICSRPQDLQGELTGPVELIPWTKHIRPKMRFGPTAFPVEDAAEVMLQVALRAHRSPKSLLRVVCLQTPGNHDAPYAGRSRNEKAQSSWTSLLSPSFGSVIGSLGKRPDNKF